MENNSNEQKALDNLRTTYKFVFGRKTPLKNISGPQKIAIQTQCRNSYIFLKEGKYDIELNLELAQKLFEFYQGNYFEPGIEAIDNIKKIIREGESNKPNQNSLQGKIFQEDITQTKEVVKIEKKEEDSNMKHLKQTGISFG